jgi:hypothetical protein
MRRRRRLGVGSLVGALLLSWGLSSPAAVAAPGYCQPLERWRDAAEARLDALDRFGSSLSRSERSQLASMDRKLAKRKRQVLIAIRASGDRELYGWFDGATGPVPRNVTGFQMSIIMGFMGEAQKRFVAQCGFDPFWL